MIFTDTEDPSHAIAAYSAGLKDADIPADVRVRGMHHLLDSAGIAMASATFDFAKRTMRAIHGLGGDGNVPVIGMSQSLSPRDAAMMNGFLIHGLDFDDTHIAGVVHPSASAFATALSTGIHVKASGREMLTAYIIGVEVSARLGAVAKGGFHQVGFHPTGVAGVFGSTMTAGRLMGLTKDQLQNALGLALSLASGSLEFLEDGAWNKRFHPGWAAQSGITAAAMAKEGFNGISRPFVGRFGLYNAYLGPLAEQCDISLATSGLGSEWELMKTAIKPYPACHFTHANIDAALILREKGATLDKIDSITALVPAQVVKTVCEPEANKKRPSNSYDAQFSIPYLVATAIKNNRMTLSELEDTALRDPETLDLAKRVSYRTDPDSPFPKAYSGDLIVTLKDGTELRHREHINRGADERPLTNAEIVEKYDANAAVAGPRNRATAIRDTLLSIDSDKPLAPLRHAFVPFAAEPVRA